MSSQMEAKLIAQAAIAGPKADGFQSRLDIKLRVRIAI